MKKEQQVIVVIGLGLIFYLYAFFNFMYFPLNKNISELKKSIEEKTKKVKEAKLLAESLPQLKQETEILNKEIAELEKKLPRNTDIPSVIKIVSRQSQNFGIKINSLTPRDIDISAPRYKEIPFTLDFSGSFHSVGQLLTELAQGNRIIGCRDLVLNRQDDKNYPISGNCIIYAFSLK